MNNIFDQVSKDCPWKTITYRNACQIDSCSALLMKELKSWETSDCCEKNCAPLHFGLYFLK